jgi:hypothetical protein
MNMSSFEHSTARIAAWNLAGYGGIPVSRIKNQVEGLSLLDAEVVALVELNPITAIEDLKSGLAAKGIHYESIVLQQQNDLNIGVLYKQGITATNAYLLDGSDLNNSRRRKALVVDMKVGRFDFKLIVVHLKSGRGNDEQQIRDEQAKIIGQFISI